MTRAAADRPNATRGDLVPRLSNAYRTDLLEPLDIDLVRQASPPLASGRTAPSANDALATSRSSTNASPMPLAVRYPGGRPPSVGGSVASRNRATSSGGGAASCTRAMSASICKELTPWLVPRRYVPTHYCYSHVILHFIIDDSSARILPPTSVFRVTVQSRRDIQELSSCCHSEERSDQESTISPPPGERHREGGLRNSTHED